MNGRIFNYFISKQYIRRKKSSKFEVRMIVSFKKMDNTPLYLIID